MTKKWTKALEKFENNLKLEVFSFEYRKDLEKATKAILRNKETFEKYLEGSLFYDNISKKEFSAVYRKMWEIYDVYFDELYEIDRENRAV